MAHAPDEALPLGHADRAACVEHVEEVAAFDDAIVGGEDEALERFKLEDELAALPFLFAETKKARHLALIIIEEALVELDVRALKIIGRPFPFGALQDLAVADAGCPFELVDVVDVLEVHRDALKSVRELARDGLTVDAAALLKIGELADLETIEPDLPAE